MRGLIFALPLTLSILAQPLAAEVGIAKILAPWEANGQLFQVAVDRLQFIGTFEGIMYIESGDGLLDAALFTCPSTQIIHILSNELQGHGYCTIESPTGDYVYAEFNCNGQPGSCKGTFTLTGGTGKLTGITGESAMIVRTALSGTSIDQASGGTVSAAKGLAIWPEMRFEVPGGNPRFGMLGTGPGNADKTDETQQPDESSPSNDLGESANPVDP
ncbi:hypothetical protein CCR95_06960 [Thiocystis minor]|uniref:hypothetical protein n=1 Tax=Thiocystis minor TaxID=61597 RepID=UPI0019124E42|nr:hypothetical protein [Thiocystis minor]MBK5963831.1 hypothetical protein [Thiocystis minor]